MPYTIKEPPDWLKSLPDGAVKIGVEVFNNILAADNDEDKARQAAWSAIKQKYEKGEDGEWRAKTDVSLDDIRNMLWNAVQDKFGKEAYLNQVYGSYIIYEQEGKFYQLSYSILEGNVQFGSEPVEVERVWVEARGRQEETDEVFETLLRLDQAKDPEGAVWDIIITEPGFTKNGWYQPEDVVREAAGLFEGVDVNLYELPSKDATHVGNDLFPIKSLLVKNKAGWIDNVKYIAGRGLTGVLHFLDSAKWIGANILKAVKDGVNPPYGLSYDCPVRAKKDVVNGTPVIRAIKFLAADSVDLVTRPAAGGKFNRAIASMRTAQSHKEDRVMNKKQLWDLITEKRPDLLNGKEFDKVTDEEMLGLARMAMEPAQKSDNGDGGTNDNFITKEQFDQFRCSMALDAALGESCKLPKPAKDRIRTIFKDKIFKQEDLDRSITDEMDYIAQMAIPPEGGDVAASHIIVGIGTLERAQMAVDRLFGLNKDDMTAFAKMERLDHQPFFSDIRSRMDYEKFDEVPTFKGLRDMYLFFTGDKEVTGRFMPKNLPADLRARMDITSSTFSYVLGNTLGRRLVKDYNAVNYNEDLLISVRKSVADFRQQEAVNVGYFGDLDTVDPEAADYEEISAITDEESTYAILQKGNILTITRKTIINDDITLIQRLVGRIGRAARRTHGKYVWNFFINNANCSDGTAWFTNPHGNLGSGALSLPTGTALAAYQALAKMTEKDSGERIGLLDDPSIKPTLIYPVDLLATGESVVNDDDYYTSNDLTTKTRNPMKGKVNGAMITLLTDATDWGMLMPPAVADMIEMGYLNGRQEPEMFVADMPQSEQVFVADKIRHKIRHEYAGAVVDFRSGYKAVVAG